MRSRQHNDNENTMGITTTPTPTRQNDDEDFVLGVDFSKLEVSEVMFDDDVDDHTKEKLENNEDDQNNGAALWQAHCAKLVRYQWEDVECEDDSSLQSNATTSNMDRLFQWAQDKGANLENVECCQDAFGGNGLYYKQEKSISAGSMVATLPRSLRIGQNHACGRLGLPKSTPDLSALSLLLVDALMDDGEEPENHRLLAITDDNFSLYAKCLPRRCHNALSMSPDEQNYWGRHGKEYLTDIGKVQDQAQSCWQYIQDCLLPPHGVSSINAKQHSSELLLPWAISMVQSRTHSFGSHKSRWLTPILDLCNHSTAPNCRLEGDSQGNLLLRAIQNIHQGDEITIDYQVLDDAKLVATYGFSLIHPLPPPPPPHL